MPRSYEWIRASTISEDAEFVNSGTVETLADVDKAICEMLGHPVQEKIFSQFYDSITNLAYSQLMELGGSHIEQRHIDGMIALLQKQLEKPRTDMAIAAILGIIPIVFKRWRFLGYG